MVWTVSIFRDEDPTRAANRRHRCATRFKAPVCKRKNTSGVNRLPMSAFWNELRTSARRNRLVVLVLALLCAAIGALLLAPTGRDSPYLRDDIRIPVPDRDYSLALTIVRPRGEG